MTESDILTLAIMLAIFGTIIMLHLAAIQKRKPGRRSTDMPWSRGHENRRHDRDS